MENNVSLSSPWVEYLNKLTTLFGEDEEIHIEMGEPEDGIHIKVDNQIKADALSKLLPMEKVFGNITVPISVIPSNVEEDKLTLLSNAFHGNPVVSDISMFGTVFGNFTCVMFQPIVAQYYNDNMRDPNGITSTLYQELAKDIFGDDGSVVYCTEDVRM